MSDRQILRGGAIISWVAAFVGYYATMAPTTSFWDCGEFIACAVTMGVPHPPGSPLYVLVGRVFSMLPTDTLMIWLGLASPESDIAFRVTLMSPIAGSLAALATYLIVVRLIRQISPTVSQDSTWTTAVGGMVGAGVFAFSYSNWFNAVEGEVYAYAIFFMMASVWLTLRWTDEAKTPNALRLMLLMAYVFGIAGGVHLLVLLVIPTIVIIALFTYFSYRDGLLLLGGLACLGLAGYFALHVANAWGLKSLIDNGAQGFEDVKSRTQAFGFDDPSLYFQLMLFLTLISLVAAFVIPAGVKKIRYRTVWTVGLTIISAVGLFKAGSDTFYYAVGQAEFPVGTWLGSALALAGAVYITQGQNSKIDIRSIFHITLACELLFVLGYSTYLVLMVRSGLDPRIDENNPENWHNFFLFLSRKQYGDESQSLIVLARKAAVGWQFWDMFVKYFVQQFPMSLTRWFGQLLSRDATDFGQLIFRNATDRGTIAIGLPDVPLLLGFGGMFFHAVGDKRRFIGMMALFLISGVGLFVYLNMPDPQPRERHYVFTGASSVFAIWIGIGATGAIRWVAERWSNAASYGAGVVAMVIPVWFVFGPPLWDHWSSEYEQKFVNWQTQSRRGDFVAYDYAYNILQSCDEGGIIFTNGDNDTFPLWYLQEALGVRRDVRIVNLSLLNTSWYIKQLRDNEPVVQIGPRLLDDNYIDNVLCGTTREALVRSHRVDVIGGRLSPWKAKTVRATPGVDTIRIEMSNGTILSGLEDLTKSASGTVRVSVDGQWTDVDTTKIASITRGYTGLEWTMGAASDYGILRVQDVMVYNIIHYTNWQRPIYFAVTVSDNNKIGLQDHLRMEGMVFRLVLEKSDAYTGGTVAGGGTSDATNKQLDRWMKNLFEVYKIRYLKDPEIFKDDNMLKLVSNYRSAYLQAARLLATHRRYDDALKVLEGCEGVIPWDRSAGVFASQIARQAGDNDAALYYATRADTVTRQQITALYGHYVPQELLNGSARVPGIRHVGFAYERVRAYDHLVELMRFVNDRTPGTSAGGDPTGVVTVRFELARALRLSGQIEEARSLLESLRLAYPGFKEVQNELNRLGPAPADTVGS